MARGDELETGAHLARELLRSTECAERCYAFLYQQQTGDEQCAGTSIHRNGVGFDKHDAERIAGSGKPRDGEQLKSMVRKYTTQLARAVLAGELALGEYAYDDEEAAASEEVGTSSSEEGDDSSSGAPEAALCVATTHGIFQNARMVLPSKTFGARAVQMAAGFAAPHSAEHPPWTPEDVQQAINEADKWLGVAIGVESVDLALYTALPAHTEPAKDDWVRFFWAPESRWITGRVTGFDMNQGVNRSVTVHIPEEEASATLTGPDALYLYLLAPCDAQPRKRRRFVVDDEE